MAQIGRLVADVGKRRAASREYARIQRAGARHRLQLIRVKIGCGSDGGQPRYLAGPRNLRITKPYAAAAVASPVHLPSPGIGRHHEIRRTCSSKLGGDDVETADSP